MIKKLNTVPDIRLTTKTVDCTPVEKSLTSSVLNVEGSVWSNDIINLVQDLKDTAESLGESCVGLSANQIWDQDTPAPSVFIVKMTRPSMDKSTSYFWQEFINPKLKTSGKSLKIKEGCMSVPGVVKNVKRESNVTISFQTLNNATPETYKFFLKESFASIIIQHEYDHLNGKTIA